MNLIRSSAVLCFVGSVLCAGSLFAAAGSPPQGPIAAPRTGADLKTACGQNVSGYNGLVGEKVLREMLIVQCRAAVGAIADLVADGHITAAGEPVWKCVKGTDDREALAATFVKWVGRRPALMRKPASIAFVEAIEMSAKCK